MAKAVGVLSRRRLLVGAAAIFAALRVIIAAGPLVVDAPAFGVAGDGKSDATAGLNAAARSLPESGGTLRLRPAGSA
jgi:hypothetical protein